MFPQALHAKLLIVVAVILFLLTGLANAAGKPPNAPSNLHGVINNNQVTLTWGASGNDDGQVGYNVYVDNKYKDTVYTTNFTMRITDRKQTSFYLHAFDARPRRYSQRSAILMFSDISRPPTTPTNLTGVVADGQASIRWTASTDEEEVIGYNIYRDNSYQTTVFDTNYSTDNPTNKSYSWSVIAFDVHLNYSAFSKPLNLPATSKADTKDKEDTKAPSTPRGLQAKVSVGPTSDTVQLSWQASTDNHAVRGYNIYLNGQYTTTHFKTDYKTQVPSGSSNTFQVVAFDTVENYSEFSKKLAVQADTKPANRPSAPSNLNIKSITSAGQTFVTLDWNASTSAAPIRGYNIYRNGSYLTTVAANRLTDTLPIGTAANYYIIAFDKQYIYSSRSETVNVLGAINQAPFFASLNEQQLSINEPWELVIKPFDVEADPAGVTFGTLPISMQKIDNSDGSKTLIWEPTIDDIGKYNITVSAVDLRDPSVRSSQILKITVVSDAPGGIFSLKITESAFNLVEGDIHGVNIPVVVERMAGFDTPIKLSVETRTPADAKQLDTQFSIDTLTSRDSRSILNVQLSIDALPLLPELRSLVITASAEGMKEHASISLAVTPVARDDVYLLIGQSNMIGSSEYGAKLAGPGQPDEPVSRILQPNLAANYDELINYGTMANNVFDQGIVRFLPAMDPLHSPVDRESGNKGNTVGMGLSFAKAALQNTTRNIYLVPAAWSGSSFCNSYTPNVHWNPYVTENPALGNTKLFDRALERVNSTLAETGGILRGILWHQGEGDSSPRCAPLYESNLKELALAFRTRILPDARGDTARSLSANVPFVVGTMSKGRNEYSDFSVFSGSQRQVDSVHRNISSLVPFSAFTNNDDLIPENGYGCGEGSCVHFGAAALREMGTRSYQSLVRAANNQ